MPYLTENYFLNFYGGEPLLAFNLIKRIFTFLPEKNKIHKKAGQYSITTNGSLLTEEIIQFLDEHNFSVEISFDGLAQEFQRNKGSTHKIAAKIKKLLEYPNIELEVNSVFTPNTIAYLTDSIKYVLDLGVPNVRFSLSTIKRWDQELLSKLENEVSKLRESAVSHYKNQNKIPVSNFKAESKKGIFRCSAAKDRFAITPRGNIWGCFLFPDYFRGKVSSPDFHKYSFGNLDDFIQNHRRIYPKISSNYSHLSMNNFSTSKKECLFCSYLENCRVCPINAAFSGYLLSKIPDYLCKIKRIQIEEKKKFQEEILSIKS